MMKKGIWEVDGHHIRCSNCKCCFCRKDREGNTIPVYYCPNCGSEMVNGEEIVVYG